MATIKYRKFDENGYFKAELNGKTKRSVRESIEVLRRNGFFTTDEIHKLPKVWTNGRGTNAYIL